MGPCLGIEPGASCIEERRGNIDTIAFPCSCYLPNMTKLNKPTIFSGAGSLLAFLWGAYGHLNTAADLPADLGKLGKLLADPPPYLPWAIAAILIAFVVYHLTRTPQVTASEGRTAQTTEGHNNLGDGPMNIVENHFHGLPTSTVVQEPTLLRVSGGGIATSSGMDIENVHGYSSLVDISEGSQATLGEIRAKNVTVGGANSGVISTGDNCNIDFNPVIVTTDPSLKGRLRALFDEIDIIIMTQADVARQLSCTTRMFEHQYRRLTELIAEDGAKDFVHSLTLIARHPGSVFNNGSLGPHTAGDQVKVDIEFGEAITTWGTKPNPATA